MSENLAKNFYSVFDGDISAKTNAKKTYADSTASSSRAKKNLTALDGLGDKFDALPGAVYVQIAPPKNTQNAKIELRPRPQTPVVEEAEPQAAEVAAEEPAVEESAEDAIADAMRDAASDLSSAFGGKPAAPAAPPKPASPAKPPKTKPPKPAAPAKPPKTKPAKPPKSKKPPKPPKTKPSKAPKGTKPAWRIVLGVVFVLAGLALGIVGIVLWAHFRKVLPLRNEIPVIFASGVLLAICGVVTLASESVVQSNKAKTVSPYTGKKAKQKSLAFAAFGTAIAGFVCFVASSVMFGISLNYHTAQHVATYFLYGFGPVLPVWTVVFFATSAGIFGHFSKMSKSACVVKSARKAAPVLIPATLVLAGIAIYFEIYFVHVVFGV